MHRLSIIQQIKQRLASSQIMTGLPIALSLLISACSGHDAVGENGHALQEPLLNGTITQERPEVGLLITEVDATHVGICTATLIHSRIVITAAHCLENRSGAVSNVIFQSGNGAAFRADLAASFGPSGTIDDIALVRLASEVPSAVATPAKLAPFSYFGPATLYGYGCTDRAQPELGAGTKRKFDLSYPNNPAQLCPGDSGGPTITPNGDVLRINVGYFPSNGLDLYSDIQRNYKLLQDGITAFSNGDRGIAGPGGLANLSVRTRSGSGDQTLIAGFIVEGNDDIPLTLRATGPSLANFGISNFLPDPKINLTRNGSEIASNDSWLAAPNVPEISATGGDRIGAFSLTASEAVILGSFARGAYTAVVTGNDGGSGVALVEAFDRRVAQEGQAKLINLSVRTQAGTGENVIIAGFVINGSSRRRVMVRGTGRSLARFGVGGTLADPQIQLMNASGLIFSNNDWASPQASPPCSSGVCDFAGSVASLLAANGHMLGDGPLDTKDAALIATLPPGAYTAILSGADGGSGVALLEVNLLN